MKPLSFQRAIIYSFASVSLPTTLLATEVNLMNQDVLINRNDGAGDITVGQDYYTPPNGTADSYRRGTINGAIFQRTEALDDDGSGGGQFRNMYTVTNPGSRKDTWEHGYNRNGAGDAAVPGGFVAESLVRVGDLTADSTGQYYAFTVDVNESKSAPERFISLDTFQLYSGGEGIDADGSGDLDLSEVTEAWDVGPNATPGVMPQPDEIAGGASNLGDHADLLYDMDGLEDSSVFIDYSTSNGSGTFDFYVFVPISLFAGQDPNEMIYLYTEFGSYEHAVNIDFASEAGGEEVAAYTGAFNGIPEVPEPHTALLSALGGLFLLSRRARS